jgi:hypothetical protein
MAGPPGPGPWKSSQHLPQWNLWQSDYDRDCTANVPAGKHVVTVSNAEGDWVSLHGGRVSGYRSNRYPNVRALGLKSDEQAILWLQDKKSTWQAVLEKAAPAEQRNLRVTLTEMRTGEYRVAWWNTYTGELSATTTAVAGAGGLSLQVPPFARDTAAIVRRQAAR